MNRLNKPAYYMEIAKLASKRGTCSKLQVGAVLVKDDAIIGTGYNGSPRGIEHCAEKNHKGNHCDLAVHAELNSLLSAARNGTSVLGAILYTTHSPCSECLKALVNTGISAVFYLEPYKIDELVFTPPLTLQFYKL